MKKEQYELIAKTIENASEEDDFEILDVYADKIKNLKLNVNNRKLLAKQLNVDEKTALNWQIVSDVFSFIDVSTLAEEHPKEAANTLKLVVGILAVMFPIFIPISAVVVALPYDKCAALLVWLSKPTPEHVVHKIAEKKSKEKPDTDKKESKLKSLTNKIGNITHKKKDK